ncbi:Signal transduction histidine kinase [Paenibacillus sp. UNCCL117]|uniref:GAF domain-containing sensor histidine kinase n=1 Tax=unclassified Paenibacillus TaxID=185978 RepID=UPI00088EC245|nr:MULTISPECIES: GAF domain-containing sensor histidine kinase [unclassified Paenibacillus]SDE66642.1 Signal transduction histidine kinase [Paenibacillus sp. cl123]SFW70657.1 Signal transduction histidine kinase [Paenibacillus sp. UNCCL117]
MSVSQSVFRKSNFHLVNISRTLVILFSIITASLYFSHIADYYEAIRYNCFIQTCMYAPLPAFDDQTWVRSELTMNTAALLIVLNDLLFSMLYLLSASVLLTKAGREPMGVLASFMLVCFGTTFPSFVKIAFAEDNWMSNWFEYVGALGWVTFLVFFFLFPTGRFTPRWSLYPALIWACIELSDIVFSGSWIDRENWPYALNAASFVLEIGALSYAMQYRYRVTSTTTERLQTKWILYGVTVSVIAFIIISVLMDPVFIASPLAYIILNILLHLFLLLVPLSLVLAIMRRRLWDIQPLVKRTFTYAILSAVIIAGYALIVTYITQLFQTRVNFPISLASTACIVLIFSPVKEQLQRWTNRIFKGRHDDPYGVLKELRQHLVQPMSPDAMLCEVAQTVMSALQLPYAAISIQAQHQESVIAFAGTQQQHVGRFPIIHQGEQIAVFIAAYRPHENDFSSEDLELLDVLIGHAGPIVRIASMSVGMKLLMEELQLSRQKLVMAREEERLHIRRNLHDDLAPRLAALALNAATAEGFVKRDPDLATEMLTDLRKVIRETVSDIRSMVHDLRPSRLDELGLIGALNENINEMVKPIQQNEKFLSISLDSPNTLPRLAAAVEVAAYRIVTEAVVNVIRHADANHCQVQITVDAGMLQIEVIDDGIGIDKNMKMKTAGVGGIGLQSIRERAIELGGTYSLEAISPHGTRIYVVIPINGLKEPK